MWRFDGTASLLPRDTFRSPPAAWPLERIARQSLPATSCCSSSTLLTASIAHGNCAHRSADDDPRLDRCVFAHCTSSSCLQPHFAHWFEVQWHPAAAVWSPQLQSCIALVVDVPATAQATKRAHTRRWTFLHRRCGAWGATWPGATQLQQPPIAPACQHPQPCRAGARPVGRGHSADV